MYHSPSSALAIGYGNSLPIMEMDTVPSPLSLASTMDGSIMSMLPGSRPSSWEASSSPHFVSVSPSTGLSVVGSMKNEQVF